MLQHFGRRPQGAKATNTATQEGLNKLNANWQNMLRRMSHKGSFFSELNFQSSVRQFTAVQRRDSYSENIYKMCSARWLCCFVKWRKIPWKVQNGQRVRGHLFQGSQVPWNPWGFDGKARPWTFLKSNIRKKTRLIERSLHNVTR